MKTINELQNEVIEEFSDFDDWMDKYQLLIDLGNEQEPLAPEYKTEQNLIDGCQSRVWLQADMEDGKVVFQAESDALIVKGIIALLIKVVSGHTPDEILSSDLYFIEKPIVLGATTMIRQCALQKISAALLKLPKPAMPR